MRLRRPYIPLTVRVAVAERQSRQKFGCAPFEDRVRLSERLSCTLSTLFGSPKNVELHHRPAIVNRPFNLKTQDYDPPANHPDYLVYLAKDEHGIETRVRGVGAQRSDLGQRRYNKKVAKNRDPKRKARSRWPKARKLRSRAINPGWRRKAPRKTKGGLKARPRWIPSRSWPKRASGLRRPGAGLS